MNKATKDEVIFKATEYLHVIPAGEKLPFPAEFLMSKQLEALMTDLKQAYDKIIIDCPPMTAVADANIISKFSDGTIVVVASRRTNTDVAQSVVKNLKENGANIIGGILTRVQKKDHRYAAGYYYYYSDEAQEN
jgi:Mrp family chromosome partitioning ATPase